MQSNIIYGLVDPRTLLVRYVGKSTHGMTRPREHRRPSRLRDGGRRANWIKSLLALGLNYEITVLEEAASKEALYAAERWWVSYGRACEWPLTNLTDGGEGVHGWKASEATRAKISIAAKKRFASPEARAQWSVVRRGAWTPELRANIGASNKRRGQSPATRAKIAAALRTRVFTAEHRARLSAGQRARYAKARP